MIDSNTAALRSLLLPIPIADEVAASQALAEALLNQGVTPADISTWCGVELANWRKTGQASKSFSTTIVGLLTSVLSREDIYSKIPSAYFKIHNNLMKRPRNLGFDDARVLLSQTLLIVDLAVGQWMSATQIAVFLSSRLTMESVDWRAVQALLKPCGILPTSSVARIEELWAQDKLREPVIFADADALTSSEIVQAVATQVHLDLDITPRLMTLAPDDDFKSAPLVQILHYQCMLAEMYDHPPSWLYEFSPRGQAANSLFSKYPQSMNVAQNPFLNNAKATPQADFEWAATRKPATTLEARSIAEILLSLDKLGYAARRELARTIRLWIMRVLRIHDETATTTTIRPVNNRDEILKFLRIVSSRPTNSLGVIEQRTLDYLASQHHFADQFVARGLTDPVNATNKSKRKLGDCDFQSSAERTVHAYEAHAGKLTNIYVSQHLATLDSTLPERAVEWGNDAWKVDVIFVATELAEDSAMTVTIGNTTLKITAMTFTDFVTGIQPQSLNIELFNQLVVRELNSRRTPQLVRDRYKILTSP